MKIQLRKSRKLSDEEIFAVHVLRRAWLYLQGCAKRGELEYQVFIPAMEILHKLEGRIWAGK